jgi:predicted nucleic acid-binding protein
MNGNKFLIDTNVVINHLAGNTNIERLLDNATVYISAVTFSELLSKKDLTSNEEAVVRSYIQATHVIHTNDLICEMAGQIRRNKKIKMPDAIIAATCFFLDIPLVTFDDDLDNIPDLKIIKLSL